MSNTNEASTLKSDQKKSGCCGGDHDKDRKHSATPSAAAGTTKPAEHSTHEHAQDEHDDSGCCGGRKARK